ncbi:MAG TPA: glycosyltransferase [Acetobacteraceae bacterium]|jgi:spore maturation protein CgeB|nr:glycosyltransferase [Acetobacteraceae bacterium]
MRIILYTHSLVSDWNHGNAHFLRGVLCELQARGHDTLALEPEDGWSRSNLLASHGAAAVARFQQCFPELTVATYGPGFDHAAAVDDADLVLVHEWTDPALVARLGRIRRQGSRFTLLFHDTHHRAVSNIASMADLALQDYDAVLAFGEVLRQRYLRLGWGQQVFTWHEAGDTRLFRPRPAAATPADLVWIGNWGDGEREHELSEFLIEPARQLRLTGTVRGVRYPDTALAALRRTSLHYDGWVANVDVPALFASHRMTVHVPRRHYVTALPGIPTIRVFEALACGIPLVSAPWHDEERLFRAEDFLRAENGEQMTAQLRRLQHDAELAATLAARGLETIRSRHTCGHRVDELLAIVAAFRPAFGSVL